jgi:hypothetical protein
MARKFNWLDFGSLPGLNRRKLVLDNLFRYVYNPGLFSNSLLSVTHSSSGFYSCVESGADTFLLGQVYLPSAEPNARLVHLAPVEENAAPGFLPLLSRLCQVVGENGAFQMTAEMDENSPAEEILDQVGFRVYAEQQIWKLPRRVPMSLGTKAWMPTTKGDSSEISKFYQRVVPASILRVEPPPENCFSQGLICWTEGRITGFAKTQFGPKGILADLFLLQDLPNMEEYISALIFHMPYRDTKQIYLRVRSYQGRLAGALEMIGAEAGPIQKALVKRLAVHYNAKQTFRVQSFENQPDVTTPISNSKVKN